MKRYIAMTLAVWLLFLSGCRSEEPQPTNLYPPNDFSHYYELLPKDNGASLQLISHVSIDRIWDGMYAMDDFRDSWPYYIVAECTLEKVFYSNRTLRDEGTGDMAYEGDTWYLWVELPKGEKGYESMRKLLETADSFVINGYQCGPYFRPDSEMWDRISKEYSPADFAPDEYRRVEPAVGVYNLLTWKLIPVLNGKVDTESMKQTVNALYDSQHSMMFSLDQTDPENGLYFQDGSTVEELYTALSDYVSEYSEEANEEKTA